MPRRQPAGAVAAALIDACVESSLDGLSVPVAGRNDPAPSLLAHLLSADMEGFDEEDRKFLVLVLYGASFNLTHTLGNALHHLLTLPPKSGPPRGTRLGSQPNSKG